MFQKMIRYSGDVGIAKSYIDGDWDSPDLEKTLTEMMRNRHKLEKSARKK